MNDVSCIEKLGFICEDDDSKLLKALDQSDYSRFMKPLTSIGESLMRSKYCT